MAVEIKDRCNRCGTRIRNGRATCPSCGNELTQPEPAAEEMAAQDDTAEPVRAAGRRVMCPLCLSSVDEAEMLEYSGQQVCSTCSESMKNKAAKKAGQPVAE